MKLLLKIIVLQVFWFAIAHGSVYVSDIYIVLLSALIPFINFKIYQPNYTIIKYTLGISLITLYGFIQDYLLYTYNILQFQTNGFRFWQIAMWLIFICYYEDIFSKFKKYPILAIPIGAFGGAMAYYYCYRAGLISSQHPVTLFLLLAISWGMFFPISLKLYYRYQKPA